MPESKKSMLKVIYPGVETFEIEAMKENRLKKAICQHLGIKAKYTNLIFKRGGKDVIVDHVWGRQQILLGADGQAKLRGGKCVVVGIGALGNDLVRNLVLMGIGKITLIDHDKIEASNLNRTLFSKRDIGKNKAMALAELMNKHYPYAELTAIPKRVERVPEAEMADADVIISGLDSMLVRVWLADFAINTKIPLVDGGLKGLQARVQVWKPGTACLACEIPPENYAQIMDLHDSCEKLVDTKIPSFSTISSVTGSIQANEAMKIILGREPLKGVLFIDLMSGNFTKMQLDRNPDCIVCAGR